MDTLLQREPSWFASSAWKPFTTDLLSALSLSSLAANNMRQAELFNHKPTEAFDVLLNSSTTYQF